MPIRILSLLVFIAFLQGCESLSQTIQEPDVKILGVSINKSFSNPGFNTRLEITNPNTFSLNIVGLYYTLEVNDKEVASGTSNEPLFISGYGAETTEFYTSIDLLEGLALARDLTKNQDKAPSYKLRAKLKLKGIPLPIVISKEGEIDFSISS